MDLKIAVWRKAVRSNDSGDACVEVGANSEIAVIRDSKDPGGPKLVISHNDFQSLTRTIKNLWSADDGLK